MGCDIHFYVEVKQGDGVWTPQPEDFYYERNYDLFAILAGVRNGVGFSGIKTGDGFNVIAKPRGLPADVSHYIRQEAEEWGCDGHSHSWLTVAEIKGFNWKQETQHQGVVNIEEFKEFIKEGRPRSWRVYVSGLSVVNVSADKMMDLVNGSAAMQEGKSYYTTINWVETYAESVGSFLTETMPRMEALGEPNNVRAVFWFDN